MMRTRAHLAASSEQGSVSLWLALSASVMTMIIGIAVDLTGQVYAHQHTHDIAAQAARAGGQRIAAAPAVRGLSARADTVAAQQAARTYLAAADVDGAVRVDDGTTLVVTTSSTYRTKFLSIIGITTIPVHGSATARIVRAVGGSEQ